MNIRRTGQVCTVMVFLCGVSIFAPGISCFQTFCSEDMG